MNDPSAEELELLTADLHLVEARRRLAALTVRVQRQRDCGTPSVAGEELLCVMLDIMQTMTLHRELLRREVAQQRRLSSERRGR
ncbi:hypothetical protein M3I53_13170 [Paraburkholderia sp. CNPSo 3272]|uniref:hypothetical protein n=1 Tax=Paraburkholderia sp. CNPSo 3272 TaxID=2940931 RepID=UPI0020B715B8|nr:hypothetical protein [Paraburkholderia sp. CNPSo 3272]MCP3724068.1 hypothetical protein [Paraburkholderia sp. CNPSo 3272]